MVVWAFLIAGAQTELLLGHHYMVYAEANIIAAMTKIIAASTSDDIIIPVLFFFLTLIMSINAVITIDGIIKKRTADIYFKLVLYLVQPMVGVITAPLKLIKKHQIFLAIKREARFV